MRATHPDLVPYVRGYNTAKDYTEALVVERTAAGVQMAHIRRTRADWAQADGGAAAVDALFNRFDNGDLALKGTLATVIQHSPGAVTYLTDLQPVQALDAIMLECNAPISIANMQVYLNPRRDTGQRREVVTWRLRLFGCTQVLGLGGVPSGTFVKLVELAEPNDVAVAGDAAGLVTFEYADQPQGPLSREIRQDSSGLIPGVFLRGFIIAVVYALDANGARAGNCGLGYDAGTAEVTSGSYKLRGRSFSLDDSSSVTRGLWRDEGSSGGTPYVTVETGSFTEETIEFTSGNLFDLGAAPTKDVELIGLVATPPGTSVTLEVRNAADTGWVSFVNGDFENEDLGLALIQSKKMRATLTPNAAGNRTPRLRELGRQAIDRIDFSRVATIEGYEQAYSPETHKVEIPRPRLVAVKDGPPGAFSAKVEELLAQNFINDIRIRWLVGDPAVSRDKWTHMDDFLVLDSRPRRPVIELQLVGLCALLKDLAPPFSPGVNYAPDGTVSIGAYTDFAGGVVNIHLGLDEDEPDETDGIRSGTSPVNQEYIGSLPTPSDIAGRRLFLDVDYHKDQSGGEPIDVKFRIYNNTTLVMESSLFADIGVNRVRRTIELTEAQIAQLTDLPNLRWAIVTNTPAAGVGRRSHLTWVRFRSGGRREVVTYTNATLKDVYDDLITNRLAIPANLRGPGVEDDVTTVSKQVTGLRQRSPNSKDVIAKTELEAIAFLADMAIGSSEGRIHAFTLGGGQPVRAFFPSRRITIGETSPGHERRIPEYFVPYRWDREREEFKDEVRAFHADSILRIGTLALGPPRWLDEEIAKWIDTDALAESVGQRTVERLGTGQMLWSWQSSDRYPELMIGDIVAVETDIFVSRDPSLDAEVKGRRWAVGPLQRVMKGWGFTIHVRGFADILTTTQAASRVGFRIPDLYEITPNVAQTGVVTAVLKARGASSVKYAVSTSAEPSAATVRAAAPAALDSDGLVRTGTLATLTAGQTLHIAAFGYERGDGTGTESRLATAKITHYEGGVSLDLIEKSRTDYTVTFFLTARDADLDTVKIHYRVVLTSAPSEDYASPAPTSEGSFSAQPHNLDVPVDRPIAATSDRYIEAWAEDVNGNKSPIQRGLIPMMTTAAMEAAIGSFAVSAAFVGTCPTRNLVDTLNWVEGTGVPLAWVASLYVCTTPGCSPPTSGPFNADAVDGATRAAVSGAQAGLNFTADRTYRIRLVNGYGQMVDDDVSAEETTTYNNC